MNPSDSTCKPLLLPTAPPLCGDGSLVPFAPGAIPGDSGPNVPPAVAGTPTMASLVQALRRRWPLAASLGTAAAALAVFGVFTLMPATYPAQARLQIASRGDARVFGEGNDEPEFQMYKKNMEALIKSQVVVFAALNQ